MLRYEFDTSCSGTYAHISLPTVKEPKKKCRIYRSWDKRYQNLEILESGIELMNGKREEYQQTMILDYSAGAGNTRLDLRE